MRETIVESGQNPVDVAVQAFGTPDGLGTLCALNGLEYDADLSPGQVILLPEPDAGNGVRAYLEQRGVRVNSHLDADETEALATNDGEIIGTNDNEIIRT